MNRANVLNRLHERVKQNRWMRYFAVVNRIALALGFIPSGYVKIAGERFTDLSSNHPMGHYLEALYHTGYYYTFIGVAQMTAAILLLIPRTATLGALLYFPIILNITILSFSVRFDGSLLSAPLMVLANLYLLCWDYDRLKFILPLAPPPLHKVAPPPAIQANRFPRRFFAGVATTVFLVGLFATNAYDIKPRNRLPDCVSQCRNNRNPTACLDFCTCIHTRGQPLHTCLDNYHRATNRKRN
ncbi:DoxX family protein [Spirosoma rigui]|uniref:DoxX family protein n=1 Tax=Spirosoma rigui TaxID=564064 RepID=UPI0009B0E5B5|nr:DoxX family protein [Spirosoma rigui]